MPGVPYSDSWKWHPNFDPTTCRNECLVLTTDIAEGGGGDSTVCMVHRFVEPGTNKLECIGYFKSNSLTRDLATLSIQAFITQLCNQERTLLSFERNVNGEMFIKRLLRAIIGHLKLMPCLITLFPTTFIRIPFRYFIPCRFKCLIFGYTSLGSLL